MEHNREDNSTEQDILSRADESMESFDDYIRRKARTVCETEIPASQLRVLPEISAQSAVVGSNVQQESGTDDNEKSKSLSNAQPAVVVEERLTLHKHDILGTYVSPEDVEVQFTEERRLFIAGAFEDALRKTPQQIIEQFHKLNET